MRARRQWCGRQAVKGARDGTAMPHPSPRARRLGVARTVRATTPLSPPRHHPSPLPPTRPHILPTHTHVDCPTHLRAQPTAHAASPHAAATTTVPPPQPAWRAHSAHTHSRRQRRQRGDSNPCGQSPMDFESISLTARTHCLYMAAVPRMTKLPHLPPSRVAPYPPNVGVCACVCGSAPATTCVATSRMAARAHRHRLGWGGRAGDGGGGARRVCGRCRCSKHKRRPRNLCGVVGWVVVLECVSPE